LLLATRPARLTALLAASRERVRRRREEAGGLVPRLQPTPAAVAVASGEVHALLDRIANIHHH